MDHQQSQIFLTHEDGSIFMKAPWETHDSPAADKLGTSSHNLSLPCEQESINVPSPRISMSTNPLASNAFWQSGINEHDQHTSESSNLREKPQPIRSRHHRKPFWAILHNWWLEFVCCLLVIGLMVALFATIYPHQGQPLPQWPYGISINALVSTYVVILKASMLVITAEGLSQLKWAWYRQQHPLADLQKFDMASRGPIGSLYLLWNLRGRHIISSIGAFVTIGALATGPFAQQVVQYQNCLVLDPKSQASISRTNEFAVDDDDRVNPMTDCLQSAFQSGVSNRGAVNVPFNCASGNCTFPKQYQSVGYCSQCSDVTDQLTFSNTTFVLSLDDFCGTTWISNLNLSLPSGLHTSTQIQLSPYSCDVGLSSAVFAMETMPGDPTQMILGVSSKLDSSRIDCFDPVMKDSWSCTSLGYGAAECTLYPCVRSYDGKVKGGVLEELVTSELELKETDKSIISVDCLSDHGRQSLISAGYHIDEETHWINDKTSYSFLNRSRSALNSPSNISVYECIFEFSDYGADFIDFFMATLLSGQIFSHQISVVNEPSSLRPFYNHGNINLDRADAIFKNLSHSITGCIRQLGDGTENAPAIGQVWIQETCVSVRWWWLTFPAILACLTVFFFIAMVLETHKGGEPNQGWKSSPLPLMFHGLEPETQDHRGYGEVYQVDDMKANADKLHVRLNATEKGWRFTEAEGDDPEHSKTRRRRFFSFKDADHTAAAHPVTVPTGTAFSKRNDKVVYSTATQSSV